MNFDPQKFFIGLVDFFSVLMPGALLAYLGNNFTTDLLPGQPCFPQDRPENWMIFLFASYLLGHFLFLIGSILDDFVYDPIRDMTDKKQIDRLLSGRALSPKFYRWVARVCFKKHADAAVNQVVSIKNGYLKQIGGSTTAINAFQWCKARLATDCPGALVTVNRLEADSKFFRSFIPFLLILFGMSLYKLLLAAPSVILMVSFGGSTIFILLVVFWLYVKRPPVRIDGELGFIFWLIFCFIFCCISFLLILFGMSLHELFGAAPQSAQWGWVGCSAILFLLLAFWRYMDQRFKSTQHAYWFVLTLEAGKQQPKSTDALSCSPVSERMCTWPTHSGGVVYRRRGSQPIEYLLVQAKKDRNLWVLPKGHVKPGEIHPEAAVREVHEETGVWAHIEKEKQKEEEVEKEKEIKFAPVGYTDEEENVITVQFYLMKAVEEGKPEERWREHKWVTFETTMDDAKLLKESKELLDAAEKKLKEIRGQ